MPLTTSGKPWWLCGGDQSSLGLIGEGLSWVLRALSIGEISGVMMMIAFITIKSNLVPLIEGLCAQIYFRFEISVVLLTSSSFLFCEKKTG